MKKEVLIAVLIGLGLGLIVTYGIYRARTSFTSPQEAATTDDTATPSPSGGLHNSLRLLSPTDESVQTTNDIRVTGATDPDALVIIFVNDTPKVIRADSSGNFSLQSTIQSGSNVITVRAVDDDGNEVEEQRTVTFSTASFEETATSSATVTATASAKPTVKPTTKPTTSPTPKASATPTP